MNEDESRISFWGEMLRKEVEETEHLELVGCHIISSLGTALTVSSNQELCVSLEYLWIKVEQRRIVSSQFVHMKIRVEFGWPLVLLQFAFLLSNRAKVPSPEVSRFTWGLCWPPKISGKTWLHDWWHRLTSSWSLRTGVRYLGQGGRRQKSFPVVWYSHNSHSIICVGAKTISRVTTGSRQWRLSVKYEVWKSNSC